MSRQIGCSVRGPHLVEQLKMLCDTFGNAAMGGCCQNDRAPGLALGLDVVDDLRVIRQPGDVDRRCKCQMLFERRLALKQPDEQSEHLHRVTSNKRHCCFK